MRMHPSTVEAFADENVDYQTFLETEGRLKKMSSSQRSIVIGYRGTGTLFCASVRGTMAEDIRIQ
jgi:uncharacterized protein (AIM24 family)